METNSFMSLRLKIIILLVFSYSLGWGQTIPPLERKITIAFQNEAVDAALSQMAAAGKFNFSYSPTILNTNQLVNEAYSNMSIREVLNDLFGKSISAKGKGNYIILTGAEPPTRKEIVKNTTTISGYVINADTGEKIADVSVYDRNSLTGVITDQYGYFKISIDNPNDKAVLNFSKRLFLDTLITLGSKETQFINLVLRPEPIPEIASLPVRDTIRIVAVPDLSPTEEVIPSAKKSFRDFMNEKIFSKNIFSRKKGRVNVNNIKDPLYREYQVSFVPFVGTNHKLSGNVINGYSFNILGGYSRGTTKLEFGGLFNIDRGDVKYGQFAGLFNTVGGETYGVQMAGLGNLTRRHVTGGQFAGLFNANLDSVNAAQFAGLFNVNGRASQGVQVAGLFNVQPSYYQGSQFAGLLNVATHQMHGTQMSGLLNFAHNINGAQVGLINYADSIRGVPLGLMSFVSKGYHKIEFSADEVFYINAAFRTGVRQFYNILTAGLKPESLDGSLTPSSPTPTQENIWTFGYGLGTAPKITNWMYLNVDLTANHVNRGSFTNSVSLLSKLYVGLDFQLAKKFSITAGATLNGYLSDPTYAENPVLFTDFTPTIQKTHTFSNGNDLKMWWGAKVGIRFL
ncbi:MAG TPA: hypothetical protein VIS49_06565 [Cyclobacteriaceae bacterium]